MSDVLDFFTVLLGYEVELWNHLDRAVQSAHGLSLGRLQALQAVERHGGSARVNEVSSELRITVGAASKLVDRLEGDGLVLRAPNPQDRRSSLISLTGQGSGLVAAAARTVEAELRDSLPADPSGRHEVGELTASLRHLLAHLEAGQGATTATAS